MKVLYHFRVKGVGPERVHISGIAGAFQNLGHEVSFVSPTGVNPLQVGDVAPKKGLIPSLLYFLADKTPQVCFELLEILYNLMALKKLKSKIAKEKPSFIYERYAFFCISGVYLARKMKIPIILEVNEVGGFDRVRPQKLVMLSKLFERYAFKHADVVVTVSDFLKRQIVARGGDEEKILVVPNGIDKELFSSDPASAAVKESFGLDGNHVVGFVGYLVHWHRLDLLIRVFAKVKLNFPTAKLVLVGDGVLREDLQKLAAELKVDQDVIVTGRVDHSKVPLYIDTFDVAVIPNSNEYRSPIKMFEYMAMSKAVIAPDQPPITEVLQHGDTGFIFHNGDSNDLRIKIESALSSDSVRRQVGSRARNAVVQHYTWEKHAATILKFLTRCAVETASHR